MDGRHHPKRRCLRTREHRESTGWETRRLSRTTWARPRDCSSSDLPVEEGWERIAAAIAAAADPERQQAIGASPRATLSGDLIEILRRLRDEDE